MSGTKSGVYLIRCEPTGKFYVGSSKSIHQRWAQHRAKLRKGKSVCLGLQRAWVKYGEAAFTFHVLEECEPQRLTLELREQHFIDTLRPALNMVGTAKRHVSDEHIARLVALNRARLSAVTHCPRGHEYTPENTHINKRGKRICRSCNALRVSAIYARETPEQRELRRRRMAENYRANRDQRLAKMREYARKRRAV